MKKLCLKYIVCLMLFTLSSLCLTAQERKVLTDNDLNKFAGTWVYKGNGIELKLVLKKELVENSRKDIAIEFISGYHVFKEHGKLIDGEENNPKNTISFGALNRDKVKSLTRMEPDLQETGTQLMRKFILDFLTGNPDQLRFKLYDSYRLPLVYDRSQPEKLPILPKGEFILKRVSN